MAGDDLRAALFLCALQNAVKHGGVPQSGAVIGMVMGARPDSAAEQRRSPSLQKNRLPMSRLFRRMSESQNSRSCP